MQPLTQLAARRRDLGMTQEALARAVGVEPMTISRWERGESLPRRKVWPKLESVVGLPMAQILTSVGADE